MKTKEHYPAGEKSYIDQSKKKERKKKRKKERQCFGTRTFIVYIKVWLI